MHRQTTNLDVDNEQLGDVRVVRVDVDPVLRQIHFRGEIVDPALAAHKTEAVT